MAATKYSDFSDLKAKLSKKYDIRLGSVSMIEEVPSISTGNLAIDHILGVGGFPLGRIAELYGEPSSSKTTTALQTAATAQRLIREGADYFKDKHILYLDYEHALDPDYCAKLGLDIDDEDTFILAQPDNFETGADMTVEFMASGKIVLVIFDSLAAMTPTGIIEKGVGEATVALRARQASNLLQKLVPLADMTKTCVLFLNHLMSAMTMGGPPGIKSTTTPGGKALKFYSSLRVEYKPIRAIKGKVFNELTNTEEDIPEAHEIRVNVTKNKVGKPFRKAIVLVRYGRGFEAAHTAREILIGHKKIVKGGSGYYYFDKCPELITEDMPKTQTGTKRPNIQGERNFYNWCDDHPEWRQTLIDLAIECLKSKPEEDRVVPAASNVDDVLDMKEEE